MNDYNKEYYENGCGPIPYQNREYWTAFFNKIADYIVKQYHPKTVLDAGCAMGYLVEALRDRGVEAFGIDISEYALSQVREDIKPYCIKQSITKEITKEFPQHYDLITNIEVLEHLKAREGKKAIKNLCRMTDRIIFSSTPDDYSEKTHVNVRQPEYWERLFHRSGFDIDELNRPQYISKHAICFTRNNGDRRNKKHIKNLASNSVDKSMFIKRKLKKLPVVKQLNDIFISIDTQLNDLKEFQINNSLRLEVINNYYLLNKQANDEVLKIQTKIALYTVIIGKCEKLNTPRVIERDKFDYFCITDDKELISDFWKIIYIDKTENKIFKELDNCRIAKYIKTHPHEYFSNYEHSLYIDMNVQIKNSMFQWVLLYANDKDMLVTVHPERDCIYKEGDICISKHKDNPDIIRKQLDAYKQENYPTHNGLASTDVIYRVHTNYINDFNEIWWRQIFFYSKEDQLSFNYVLYNNRTCIAASPLNAYENEFYCVNSNELCVIENNKKNDERYYNYSSVNQRLAELIQAKRDNIKTTVYLYNHPDTTTCRYRCYNINQITKNSNKWRAILFFVDEIKELLLQMECINLLVLCRISLDADIEKFVQLCKQKQINIIYDIDDYIIFNDSIKYISQNQNILKNTEKYESINEHINSLMQAANLASGFIVTNDYLGKKIQKEYNKPYKSIVNTYNKEQLDISRKAIANKNIRNNFIIGYFSGTPTHNKDFEEVEDQIVKFMNKYEDVKLEIVGHLSLSEKFNSLLLENRIEILPITNYINLQELIANVDVNIVPLQINDFTNSKSELKYFEASLVKVPTIATPVFSYLKSIKNENTGYVCEKEKWYSALEKLYLDKNLKEKIANNAYMHCIEEYDEEKLLLCIESVFDYYEN